MVTVNKGHILDEIRRTARENGGVPLGKQRFYAETGIRETDWSGRHWVRWSDALKEAGFQPNRLQVRLDDAVVLGKLAGLVRELGRFPTVAELKMNARRDSGFPSHNTFNRFGPRARAAEALSTWCEKHGGFQDIVEICAPFRSAEPVHVPSSPADDEIEFGYVYLLKSGRFYKVGRSNAVGRRERELAIQLPEKAQVVHSIKTDDPGGIEFYWHRRFQDRRKNGEWFELTGKDVAAFRRRKVM
jgi:hypothetical protein